MRKSLLKFFVNYSVGISTKRLQRSSITTTTSRCRPILNNNIIRTRSSTSMPITTKCLCSRPINNLPSWDWSKAGTLHGDKKTTHAFFNVNNFHNESTNRALPVLTLYTKDPCPLCDEALEALGPALLSQVVDLQIKFIILYM